ncbi:MAG: putative ABC transporter permease [Bacilli bacterium]|nr:putative ABC transporter permease [Bacilli bacterium]
MKKYIDKFYDYFIAFIVYGIIGWLYEVFWMWFVVSPKHFVNRGVLFGPLLPIYGFGMVILLFLLKKFISRRHELSNLFYQIVSTSTIVTFIYITIIEYTTPKIYLVKDFMNKYGIGLLLINVLANMIIYYLVKKTKSEKIKKIDTTIILVFLAIWIITTLIEYISHFAIEKTTGNLLWDYTKDFLNINKRVNWDASRNFAIGGTFLLYTIQPLLDKITKKLSSNKKIGIIILLSIPLLLDYILHVLLKII